MPPHPRLPGDDLPPGRPVDHPERDLTRITLGVLFIGAMIAGTLWVLRPFVGPLIWATMIVVASWPLMLRVQAALGGRRGLAVTVMTLALLLLFVVPLVLAVVTIADNADRLVGWARFVTEWRPPETLPSWLRTLPLVGATLESLYAQARAMGVGELLPRLSPYAGDLGRWLVAQAGGLGNVLLQFLTTVACAGVLYYTGDDAARLARRFARRLAGARGEGAVMLAAGAIRGVALGVGVTAIVQSLIGGLALWLANIPFAGLLTAVMFMLSIAQVGPVPVLLPAAAWAFYEGHLGWGIFLVVVSGVVGTLDNVIRPLLIRLGAELSLLLIFAGVIGGLLAFGLVGIFIGPVLLAVAWTLLDAWMADAERPPAAPTAPDRPDWRD